MFTGLISEVGTVRGIYENTEGKVFTIEAKNSSMHLALGDSVSVNGTCLTVIDFSKDQFRAQAVWVTLQKTNLGKLMLGSHVNLELALRASDRLGGHLIQGHVNGIAQICKITSIGNNFLIKVQVPTDLQKYMVAEGSVALDGISLTIAEVDFDCIIVSIIPHTWHHTILCYKKVGDMMNIEVDIIAKYVEKFTRQSNEKRSGIDREWLQNHGF